MFNEQALANTVYAYDKTGLADGELLAYIFGAALQRMRRTSGMGSFKIQVRRHCNCPWPVLLA